MKKLLFSMAALASFAACTNAPKADAAETSDKKEVKTAEGSAFALDSSSTITWTGTKPVGAHTGTFKLKEGSLTIKDNSLSGGSFTIDINSLQDQDMAGDAENKGKLEGHLKSPDFFDAAKFPTAKFEITSVEPLSAADAAKELVQKDATHTIKGNFTLKDSTKNISFPAKITVTADKFTAQANFNIDRTLWGLNYKGPNNPQDWFIRKEVNLKLDISASKK